MNWASTGFRFQKTEIGRSPSGGKEEHEQRLQGKQPRVCAGVTSLHVWPYGRVLGRAAGKGLPVDSLESS